MTKREREAFVARHVAKENKMIRGQFNTYGIKGSKEATLTYRMPNENIKSQKVYDGDILSLPYGYVKYLNRHGSIKREVAAGMMHLGDGDFNHVPIRVEDDEKRYSFRVLDVVSAKDLEELEPKVLLRARIGL